MNLNKFEYFASNFKVIRLFGVCALASMTLGFSKPELQKEPEVASTVGMPLGEWVARPVNRPVPGTSLVSADGLKLKPEIFVISPELTLRASRPSSYASESTMNPVFDQVNSRHWLKPEKYSPDVARAELLGNRPIIFHGVGFPDIRTDRKRKHYFNAVTVDPNQWNELVTWRKAKSGNGQAEPIAMVQCMGLSPQAVARRADRYEHLIMQLSERYKVNPNLVKAVVTEESCFNNSARSHVGAQGLMQLMPATADWLKVKDPANPRDNLKGGVRYLSSLLKEFESVELALAAYNAGPGNVRRYNGVPPFAETKAYLRKVKSNYRRYAAASRVAQGNNS